MTLIWGEPLAYRLYSDGSRLYALLGEKEDGAVCRGIKWGVLAHRLSFVLTVFLLVLAYPAFTIAQLLKEIRIGSSAVSSTNLSMFYARDRKFFEKEGFDAKIIIIQTNAALAALAAGNVDYTTFSTSAIEAALKGMPIRLMAVTTQYPPTSLVVRKEITKVADLKGRKLGITSFGGNVYAMAISVLKHYGLNPKDVTIVATGDLRLTALKFRAVDAALIPPPGDIKAVALGDFKILLDAGTIYKLPSGGVSTTLKKIREDPAEVRKIVRAVVRATKFMAESQNKDDIIDCIVTFFKLAKNAADEFYAKLVPSLSPTGMVDRDKIKLVIDSAVERGLTDRPLDPDMVVDFSFVKELTPNAGG